MESASVGINVWGGLLVGSSLIAVAQGSHCCVRAAPLDVIERRDKSRILAYLMAMGVAICPAQTLFALQLVDLRETIYRRTSLPLVALIIGVIGAGMVLAGGCPNRLMIRDAWGHGGSFPRPPARLNSTPR